MKYSVIVPVYRTADYLSKCIDSILKQSYEDAEIILLDDGSDDLSSEICDNLSMNNPRVSVVHKKNEGLMMTRRRGFSIATGLFIINIDSDDYIVDIDAFKKINDVIAQNDCDLVFNDYIYGATSKKPERIIHCFENIGTGMAFDSSKKSNLYKAFLIDRPINAMWIKAAKKEIIDIDVDYSKWQKDICRAEDKFQSFPIIDKAQRIGYIAEPLYFYRWTDSSISNNPKLKYYYAFRTINHREDEYLEKWHVDNKVKEQILKARIVNILGILIEGYLRSNTFAFRKEWKTFAREVGGDRCFVELYNKTRKIILPYYRMFSYLIIHNRIHMAAMLIDTVSFISAIKHGRK